MFHPALICRRKFRRALRGKGLLLVLVSSVVLPIGARADQPAGPPPREGRITNLDSQPFSFRLARRTGARWSDPISLAPGASFVLRTGDKIADDLEGITHDGKGYVAVEYSTLGGRIHLKLPAVDPRINVYVPFWWHVKDANGFSRLLQAESREAAEAARQKLLAEPPFTAAELEAVKRTLRANFILFDD